MVCIVLWPKIVFAERFPDEAVNNMVKR
jgi:hypothetical protein